MSYSLCSICQKWPVCPVDLDQAAAALDKCPYGKFETKHVRSALYHIASKMEEQGYKITFAGPNTRVEK